MTEQFNIPATAEDALALLGEVGIAFIREGWKRTALVYALTYDADEQTNEGGVAPDGRMSSWKFAELGFAGLTSQPAVNRQRRVWALAMADGLTGEVSWGESVVLPDAAWEDYWDRSRKWKLPDTPAELLAELGVDAQPEPPSLALMRRDRFRNLVSVSKSAVKKVNELRMWDGVAEPEDIALLEQARDQFGAARDGLDEVVSREPVSQ